MSRAVRTATLIYAVSIALSRVIGLAREAVIGRVLGDQPEADVYWIAFILPDFLNYLLAGGVLALVLIPLLQDAEARGGEVERWQTFWRIGGPVSALVTIMTVALWIYTPQLTPLISPGFTPDQLTLLNRLTRIILPAQIFHVCGGLISSTLQARDRHLAPAIAPLIYTSSIILGGLILGADLGAEGFAWGVLVGSALGPFACPLIAARSYGMRMTPRWELRHPELKRYLWRALPVMLGFSVVALDEMVVKRMATALESGVVSQLHYARTLMRVPMGVFGLALGMAAFPTLSRLVSQGRETEAFTLLQRALESLLILVGLAQVGLTLVAGEFAALIWGSERLSAGGAEGIGVYCAALSLGLWAWSAQGLIARGFYARGQTWLPTLLGSVTLGACLPLYMYGAHPALVEWISAYLPHAWGSRSGIGLALASSVAISLYVVALWTALATLVTRAPVRGLRWLGSVLTRVALAALCAISCARWITETLHDEAVINLSARDVGSLIFDGGVKAFIGVSVFLITGWMLRLNVGVVRRRDQSGDDS